MKKMNQEEHGIPQISLLTPLSGAFYPDDPGYEFDEETEGEGEEQLDGADLAQYEQSITEMIDKVNDTGIEGKPRNLMDYFYGSEEVKRKVESAVVSVKNVDGILYGCTTLTLNAYMESAELTELCEYITGQYSDGWGEGFEQREIRVDGGSLYVHFCYDRNLRMQEKAVRESKQEMQETGKPDQRPKLKLLGHDGNIFSIIADARRLLIREGHPEKADEMFERVKVSGNYYKALAIISEYVETELSIKKEKTKPDKKPEKGGTCR